MTRRAVVAGRFYEAEPRALKRQVQEYTPEGLERKRALALMSPHAGLMYSGPVAGLVYASVEPVETWLLLGPNHTGRGADIALTAEDSWEIPTGTFAVDTKLASALQQVCPLITPDTEAHKFEHSLEVQLPFIAHHSPGSSLVAIAIKRAAKDQLRTLGQAVAQAVREHDRSCMIVASTDMSHYITQQQAHAQDHLAIERVLALDPDGLLEVVQRRKITMCGYLPTVVMLHAARALGAESAELLKYATSGDVSGDFHQVVGYAGVIVR